MTDWKVCHMIIGSGSCKSIVSEEMVSKLKLKKEKHHRPYKSSGCVGGLAKSPSASIEREPNKPPKRRISQPSNRRKIQWSSSTETMENNVDNSRSVGTHTSAGSAIVSDEIQLTENTANNGSFVNYAVIAWNERRREWIGDRSQRPHRVPREPFISWCTSYDDLLSTNQPFPEPVPLPEMVDFLVDIWHEEGLYD